MWILLAVVSAFLTAVVGTLTKSATEKVDSTFALGIQVIALTIFTWIAIFFRGNFKTQIAQIEPKETGILLLAGIISGIAFLCYFGALGIGESSRVQPVDRLSLVFAVVLAGLFLGEKINAQVIIGAALMAVGAVVIAMSPSK